MNRSKLKTYAPKARKEFIQAVTDRAAFNGLTKEESQLVTVKGDVAIIGGKAFPRSVAEKRRQLEDRIERKGPNGFDQVMEAVAYTWFNRLVAIRFMELHGYLDHGYRVLSHPEGKSTPEIVEHAEHVDLPGLNKQRVIDLKLDGTKESELFRMLLIAQCNALHAAMPFLFERIDDETELLLPDNLLHSDSIVRKLVCEIDEADWQQVEIIGWLYEEYISERYKEVIGKVVKTEDIPAATQRFTPNWIVKYLVQNSLGRQWLATYPDSMLKSKWEYYIEPAEQTPEVQAKLGEITPTSLNPEELTIIDPACGSGHILVEAYDLLKDIYLERGYRLKDVPRLILTKNAYGLEIDDRAAQLSCFALMMKAREDDRKIFDPPPQLNVLAIQESNGLPVNTIVQAFTEKRITKDDDLPAGEFGFMVAERAPLFAGAPGESKTTPARADEQIAGDLKLLLALFDNAKTFGSLIAIPPKLAERLPALAQAVEAAKSDANLAVQGAAKIAAEFVMAAILLARQYHSVVANPPYMGDNYYTPLLKAFVIKHYKAFKGDLYACFLQRNAMLARRGSFVGMITIPNWMFLSGFEDARTTVFRNHHFVTFNHNGRGVFGSDFGSCAFVLRTCPLPAYRGTFLRLFDKQGGVTSNEEMSALFATTKRYTPQNEDFAKIPGSPIAYWASPAVLNCFATEKPLSASADCRQGLTTASDRLFLRRWWEPSIARIGFGIATRTEAQTSRKKWFPLNKGGAYRKWYGNHEYVVDWADDGARIKKYIVERYPYLNGNPDYVAKNPEYYFRGSVTWSRISISKPSFRQSPPGTIIGDAGPGLFCASTDEHYILGMLNSAVSVALLEMISPTVHFQIGTVSLLPIMTRPGPWSDDDVKALVELHKLDWDSFETSWGFQSLGLLNHGMPTIRRSQHAEDAECEARRERAIELEKANDRGFIRLYGLQAELTEEPPDRSITLHKPDRALDVSRCLSSVVGCALGRYSFDKPGLIYANSGNEGFDPSQYKAFPADPDGIIPVTEYDWFPDSAARRFEEFVGVAWPKEHLEENLQFVAESLAAKGGDEPRETIRRYFANDFYKHHLQTYKKRPIYWLFSSGKQRAFQALVYLHRYHEGTLARMRTEYVIPLQGKIASRISQLEGDIGKATSSAHTKKLTKEKDAIVKQQAELREFDEKLRHYADQWITLDLDDGVKVNYGKFGDLLAEVKAICGDKEDEE